MKLPKRNQKVDPNSSRSIAENNYQSSYYKGSSEIEKGLAETHEQVSDQFTAGTIDQLIEK